MADDIDAFIQKGVLEYHGKALATIDEFLRRLGEALKKVLQERSDQGRWSPFEPAGLPEGPWPASTKRNVQVALNGRLRGEDTRLTLGVWWDKPGPEAVFVVQMWQTKLGQFIQVKAPENATDMFTPDSSSLCLRPSGDRVPFVQSCADRLIDATLKIVC